MISSIAPLIDHTLLRADATPADIARVCDAAVRHHFASVCVAPAWVENCASRLASHQVAVCTVIGFPLGSTSTKAKLLEMAEAISAGATELDVVAPLHAVRSGEWQRVADEFQAVVSQAGSAVVKFIIEAAALSSAEKTMCAKLAAESGAHFVKTSTGFFPGGGASVEDVRLIREVVGPEVGIKASGGIRDCRAVLQMLAAGATRIGTSSGVQITECLGPTAIDTAEVAQFALRHQEICVTSPRE